MRYLSFEKIIKDKNYPVVRITYQEEGDWPWSKPITKVMDVTKCRKSGFEKHWVGMSNGSCVGVEDDPINAFFESNFDKYIINKTK